MGSRAVVIICKDEEAAQKRFRVTGGIGSIYTRTGRPFFSDHAVENDLLQRVYAAADRAGWWEELQTDWICLDGELMPWSAKAQDLLRNQYAAVGSAATAALAAVQGALDQTSAIVDVGDLLAKNRLRVEAVSGYLDAYRRYCWPVESVRGLRMAPVPRLATGGVRHSDKGIAQPALKCRGREYLRIIYGPEYTLPENLDRLRARGLGLKRSLAMREFALGIESLERFVRHEPLHRVHECAFAVLALESEPVDPRL